MQLRGVLRKATVTRLAMLEQVLQHVKRMLDLSAHAGLGLLQLFFGAAQRIFFNALRTLRFIAMCQVTDLLAFSGRLSAPS